MPNVNDLKPDYKAAAKFLGGLPTRRIHVCAIHPEGNFAPHWIKGHSFRQDEAGIGGVEKFMEKYGGLGYGLYFYDNDLSVTLSKTKDAEGHVIVKAAEAEVARVNMLHADLDPPKGTLQADMPAVKAEMIARAQAYRPGPTIIIDSGNGLGLFWSLDKPIKVTDENREQLRGYNAKLALDFGADSCWNLDRVMRVPHTLNVPNKAKLKLGRVPVMSSVILDMGCLDDRDINDFTSIPVPSGKAKATADDTASAGANAAGEYAAIGRPEVPTKFSLERLGDKPADKKLRKLIEDGAAANSDRSSVCVAVAAQLRKRGATDGEIIFILSNRDYGISAHVLEQTQRDPKDTVARILIYLNEQYERDHPWDKQCAIVETPPSFCLLNIKKIMTDKSFDKRYGEFSFEPHKDANLSTRIERFGGYVWNPDPAAKGEITKDGERMLNIYRGQDIEPLAETPARFLAHVAYIIPNETDRNYLLDFMAHCVQHPAKKIMFAILLVGPKGTGKSFFVEVFKALFNERNVSEPSKKTMLRDFNAWAGRKQIIAIHELKSTGRADVAEILKEKITQGNVEVNIKNVEAFTIDNFANYFTITNDEDAIPLESGERRYLVIRCAEEPMYGKRNDKSVRYYEELFLSIGGRRCSDHPGDEARRILHYLKNRPIKLSMSGFAPKTAAMHEMIEATFTNIERAVADLFAANVPPMGSLFATMDVLDELDTNLRAGISDVERACRKLGCRPLRDKNGNTRQVRIGGDRKRLWARTASRAAELSKKTGVELAAMFNEITAAHQGAEHAPDGTETETGTLG
jgi:Family of unknown function (DUF5906)